MYPTTRARETPLTSIGTRHYMTRLWRIMGNCVIIDHGNSEYSVMAHMQQGSVTVKVGERVAAGQVIGRLGNSGDSFGPHLHYQLQSGPQLFHDQALPFRFQNIDVPQLSRGREVEAR